MSYGFEVTDENGVVMLESSLRLMRVVLALNYPSLAPGGSWVHNDSKITSKCLPLLYSSYVRAVCSNGFVTIYNNFPTVITAPAGSFTITKGLE